MIFLGRVECGLCVDGERVAGDEYIGGFSS